MMEEPEMTVGAKNVQLKCPDCDQIEQVIHIGGPPERAHTMRPTAAKFSGTANQAVAFA